LTGCTGGANGWKDGIHTDCTAASFSGLTCTGYRLPTESEWEYASRGGTTGATYLGNLSGTVTGCSTAQANLDGIAWWCRNSGGRTQAVGGKTANSFGLSDMLGNVWEWTGDWYGNYPAGSVTDPLGAGAGSGRVNRGGSWSGYAHFARAANRGNVTPANRNDDFGFRLSMTAP
jgi:formylglycine-generating enzyme required for sulfatase activity